MAGQIDHSGIARFSFTDIAQGRYFLIVGSDLDNDYFICGEGELCGAYPEYNQREEIVVTNTDLSGLWVTVSPSSIGLNSVLNNSTDNKRSALTNSAIEVWRVPETNKLVD